MNYRINIDDVSNMVESSIASISYADKKKTSKRIVIFVDPVRKNIWFEILIMGKFYGKYETLQEAVDEYNLIS